MTGFFRINGIIAGIYFYISDDSATTEEAKQALMNRPLMTQKYADEESHIVVTNYSTIMYDFKLNGNIRKFSQKVD